MKTSIAILDNLNLVSSAQEALRSLSSSPLIFSDDNTVGEEQLIKNTGSAEAVLVSFRAKITKNYLDRCPSVKYIGICGTSLANVDRDEVARRGITLTNVKDYGDEPATEFIFFQLIGLLRGAGKYQWKEVPHELMGKSIGIIGLGALGKAIANVALACKMRVSYCGPHNKFDWENRGVEYKDLQKLLTTNEIICISSPTNMQVLGKEEFKLIKQGSILIQASVGNVFDRAAFLEWINQESNFAIFDYSAGEENLQTYKDLPRVIFSNIVAGLSIEARERLGAKVVDNLRQYLKSL